METNKIYVGNNLDTLKTFPDKSINCCITSPPYYGLRDYGTGKWEGGDPNCNHFRDSKLSHSGFDNGEMKQHRLGIGVGDAIYKSVCPKCGAVRIDEQVGLEDTPEAYIERLVGIFREIKRCLTDDGTLWVNIGDTYCSSNDINNVKPKDLIGIPWMLAFALRNDGWYLRQDIIWHKPAPMPESVRDRFTKAHEYIFMLSKSKDYYFDHDAIQEDANPQSQQRYAYSFNMDKAGMQRPDGGLNTSGYKGYVKTKYDNSSQESSARQGINKNRGLGDVTVETDAIDKNFNGKRNKRDVWSINTSSFKGAHFATFPEELVRWCLLAGCPKDGVVLDPFMGSGTVGVVAKRHNRKYVGTELNPEYAKMAENRIGNTMKKLF